MYDPKLWDFPIAKSMAQARSRASQPDPDTGRVPAPRLTREQRLKEMKVCHQPKGGPCRFMTLASEKDQRCGVPKGVRLQCPYLGEVAELLEQKEQEQKREEQLQLIYEPPPEVDE